LLASWVPETLKEITIEAPYGDGRVNIGLAFDGVWLPKEVVVSLFETAKSVGVKLITIHTTGGLFSGKSSHVLLT